MPVFSKQNGEIFHRLRDKILMIVQNTDNGKHALAPAAGKGYMYGQSFERTDQSLSFTTCGPAGGLVSVGRYGI